MHSSTSKRAGPLVTRGLGENLENIEKFWTKSRILVGSATHPQIGDFIVFEGGQEENLEFYAVKHGIMACTD